MSFEAIWPQYPGNQLINSIKEPNPPSEYAYSGPYKGEMILFSIERWLDTSAGEDDKKLHWLVEQYDQQYQHNTHHTSNQAIKHKQHKKFNCKNAF